MMGHDARGSGFDPRRDLFIDPADGILAEFASCRKETGSFKPVDGHPGEASHRHDVLCSEKSHCSLQHSASLQVRFSGSLPCFRDQCERHIGCVHLALAAAAAERAVSDLHWAVPVVAHRS